MSTNVERMLDWISMKNSTESVDDIYYFFDSQVTVDIPQHYVFVQGMNEDMDNRNSIVVDEREGDYYVDWTYSIGYESYNDLLETLNIMKDNKIEFLDNYLVHRKSDSFFKMDNTVYPMVLYDPMGDEICRRFNITHFYYCAIVDMARYPEKYEDVRFDASKYVKKQLKTPVEISTSPSTYSEVFVSTLRYISENNDVYYFFPNGQLQDASSGEFFSRESSLEMLKDLTFDQEHSGKTGIMYQWRPAFGTGYSDMEEHEG